MNSVDYIFCFTGDPSSGVQALNSTVMMWDMILSGEKCGVRYGKSCNIYVARNGCLSTKGSRKNQKPFEDVYEDYKKMIWVDSDNFVSGPKVKRLLSHDVDIVGAWYRQYISGEVNDTNKSSCGFKSLRGGQRVVTSLLVGQVPSYPRNEKGLIEVDFAGFGLMVIKKGVFESLSYPWFRSWIEEWEENGHRMAENITDDEGFCMRAKEKGFKIFIEPECRLEHEKKVAI